MPPHKEYAFVAAANPVLMAERPRPREEPERCSVSGCKEMAERSVSTKKHQAALPGVTFSGDTSRRVGVCRAHYRDFRKATKEERELDRLGW